MGSRYHVRTITMANGERRAMLCERETGLPLANPTLYVTSMLYLPGREYNTQDSALTAIHFLYLWAARNRIDLEASFQGGYFLSQQQIEGLLRDARLDLREYQNDPLDLIFGGGAPSKPPKYRRRRPRRKVKPEMFNKDSTTRTRLFYIKGYLDWLATGVISRTSAKAPEYEPLCKAREAMINAIAERIPGEGESHLRRGLSQEERKRFLAVIEPKDPGNPFKSDFVKVRNQLIGHLLFNLGCRRGELLLIKESDIDWNPGSEEGSTVGLQDHPRDPKDTRRVRPQFKTEERRLPLGRNLARQVKSYIQKYRDKIGAGISGR